VDRFLGGILNGQDVAAVRDAPVLGVAKPVGGGGLPLFPSPGRYHLRSRKVRFLCCLGLTFILLGLKYELVYFHLPIIVHPELAGCEFNSSGAIRFRGKTDIPG